MFDPLECLKLSTTTLLSFTIFIIFIKSYLKLSSGRCKSRRRIDGQVAIVTGANSGIGYETALDLANRGGRVYLACRDIIKAVDAADKIMKATGNRRVYVKKLDTSLMSSVREFCEDFMDEERGLDILVCNSGVSFPKKSFTQEGLEINLATNHIGHFLLANILIGLMKRTGSASGNKRIIIVSSSAYSQITRDEFDLDNLNSVNSQTYFNGQTQYAISKLCNILMAKELCKRLEGSESLRSIQVNSLNPGASSTDITRHYRTNFIMRFLYFLFSFFFKSAKEGAQTVIQLAVSEEVEGISGEYWSDCKIEKLNELAEDPILAKRLWEKSEALAGLHTSEYNLAKQVRFSLKN